MITIAAIGAAMYTTAILATPDHQGDVSFTIVAAGIGDGVDTSTQVRLHGLPIGTVTRIASDGTKRVVTLAVKKPRAAELTTSMQTRFVSSNAFGSTAIELIPGSGGLPITPGTVINYQQEIRNYTVTNVLRSAEAVALDVVTPQLSGALNNAADLTRSMSPAVTASLAVMRAWKQSDPLAVDKILRAVANAMQPAGPVVDGAVTMLQQLLDVPDYENPHLVQLTAKALPAFSQLAFGFVSELVVAAGPLAPAIDVLNAYLTPTTYGLRDVTASQIQQLITRLGRSFTQTNSGRVDLNVQLLIDAFPSVGVPLMLVNGVHR
ncbi:MlaD family protein [Jongsikchunia kroppenstedtii]|uniref:MlaD family protein n=1 Tax=Jongsikchunia kroppenstedtii TaxID=1121721 RepID=UPI00138B09C9|nr:MlaD family protein [Jongsikchunia kroppenstedtii]